MADGDRGVEAKQTIPMLSLPSTQVPKIAKSQLCSKNPINKMRERLT
jgi:hypothetical protein